MMNRLLFFKMCAAVVLALLCAGQGHAAVTLNATNFPDANFRAALSAATGVAEGGTINESTLTSLDVSNKGITSLKGLELLTGLTDVNISGNSLLTTGASLTNLTSLQTVKASNCNITTLAGTTGDSDHPGAGLTIGSSNSSIIYLDLSYNTNFYTSGNLQYLTHLETLLLNNCTNYDYWGTDAGNGLRSVKRVDVSYCTALDRIFLPNATQLEHLNAEGTLLKGFTNGATAITRYYIVLPSNSRLKYLNIGHCAVDNTGVDNMTHYCASTIETLILRGNSAFGYSSAFQQMSALTYLDISDCDIYFRVGTSPHYLLYYLTPTNNPNLETLISSNSAMGSFTEGLTGFTKLKTVDISGNSGVTQFWVNGSPLLESLNISGLNRLTYLELNNDALPRSNFTLQGAGSCTALRSLFLNGNNYASIGQATSDFSSISTLAFLYLENNSGFTGGPLTMDTSDCGTLKGIDLGNNGFTSFSAPSLPETLTALMLGSNPSMTRLEMHNNPGITTMTSSPVMADGSGLYLLGNSALTYMDISGTEDQPNHFKRIGNNGSLNGVPIDTLKASYNKFYTFRNQTPVAGDNYERWSKTTAQYDNIVSSTPPSLDDYYYAYWPASPAQTDSASLEHLTGLKYLDLSHCQLKDSLYLHNNRELRYLDVSHNRSITRYTTSHDKGAAYRASIPANSTFNRDFPDYKKYLWLVTNHDDREYFTGDYNDTTGLYILDLMDNDKLEYLDISYTGIEQTALTHCHVSNARYIWIQDLNNLKYFYADYNGMRSMGIGTLYGKRNREGLKSLERLSVIGMRGTDDRTMQGSINFRSNSVCTKLHYVNLSYSRFDSIGVYAPQIDTLIIKGNPLHYVDMQMVNDITYLDASECAYKMRGYDVETGNIFYPDANRYQNGARVGGTYNGAITTPLSGLKGVRAFNRPKLTTVLLDNCNGLRDVYCHHDPVLPRISGFDNLAFNKSYDAQYGFPTVDTDSLHLVWVNDNEIFNELNLTKNENLHYLHAYNDKALGTALGDPGMDLTANKNLISAWVSNSLLRAFTNDAKENLDTLKIWQNPQLNYLDVSKNTDMRWFDLRNCMLRELDVTKNTRLEYFDCSNMDSISAGWNTYNNYGFEMPRQVPTAMDQPGKNSIADLHFGSKALQVVHADNNDLYCMDGLNDNTSLNTLTYSYNHINAIDLSGCPSITEYNCYHNVRGLIQGELSTWDAKVNGEATHFSLYYLQLEEDAGDALVSTYDTFLGHKCGQDSIESLQSSAYLRQFTADGFDPTKVISFTVNSSGPYVGTRGREDSSNAPRRASVTIEPGVELDPSTIYGTIAIIRIYDTTRNYIEYLYDDGRPAGSSKAGGGSGFGIALYPPGEPTHVEETTQDGLGETSIVSERYFDTSGKELTEPVSGVNIVIRQMSDGTTQTLKILK